MIEFMIVLLAKRRFENKVSPIKIDTKHKTNIKIGSKNTTIAKSEVKLKVDEKEESNRHENPHNRYLKTQLKRALFNSLFEPNENPNESSSKKHVEKNTSYKKIDIASAILFPIAYAFFNIIYWTCVI